MIRNILVSALLATAVVAHDKPAPDCDESSAAPVVPVTPHTHAPPPPTVTRTTLQTIISCGPEVPDCPAGPTPHPPKPHHPKPHHPHHDEHPHHEAPAPHHSPAPAPPAPTPVSPIVDEHPVPVFPGSRILPLCDASDKDSDCPSGAPPAPTHGHGHHGHQSDQLPVAPSPTPGPYTPHSPPVYPASPVWPASPVSPYTPIAVTPSPTPAPTPFNPGENVPVVPVGAAGINRPLAGISLGVAAILAVANLL